ncbi:MAG: sugar phosphate isomerase/epimerase [Clostridia bacterium]|nr:sugar phosphate isomerase/epimerase [Clostridia bacterium]
MKIGIMFGADESAHKRWGDGCYKKLKEFGYSCIDYNLADTDAAFYTASQQDSDAMLLHERELIEAAGMEISQVHGPWRWPARDFTDEDRSERMEKMKKSIRMTSVLGCKNWVIHPIMPYGTQEIDTEDAQKTWDMNLVFMRELLETAKEYDVTICFENMPMLKFSLAKPADILRFVKTINDEHFKICLDTGHVSVYQQELSLGDAVREMGSEIRVLHVHDNKVGWDLHLMPQYGIIDWDEFAKALGDINFGGVFSLETLPPAKLPSPLFEEMFALQAKIAEDIIKKIRA